jgi:hypothetical protein
MSKKEYGGCARIPFSFFFDRENLRVIQICYRNRPQTFFFFYSCTMHSVVIQFFISPTNAQLICFKTLKFTLKYTVIYIFNYV